MSLTYKELSAQYESLQKCADLAEKKSGEFRKFIEGRERLAFIGCGSSYSVCKSLSDTFNMRNNGSSLAIAAGDLLIHAEKYIQMLNNSVIFSISRSGSTSEIVKAIEILKEKGCIFTLVSISCVEDSPLDKISDFCVNLPWAYDESVCQTRTVSSLYFYMVYTFALLNGNEAMKNSLLEVVKKGPDFLKSIEGTIKELAVKDWDHAVTLGDAEIAGICEEGALAFKEICMLPSNYYHFLDCRHGPMVLFNSKTLIIAAVSDTSNKLECDLLRDLAEKGPLIIAVGSEGSVPGLMNISWGSKLDHTALGLVFILVCQLLSYYKALETGSDPDKPTGLSAWIKL